jgi:hypothetical protein
LKLLGKSTQVPGVLSKTIIKVKMRQPWTEDMTEGIATKFMNVTFLRHSGCRVIYATFIRQLMRTKLNMYNEERLLEKGPSISLASLKWETILVSQAINAQTKSI